MKRISKDELLKKEYVVCPKCGYNNKIDYTKVYGDCLKCKTILNDKVYYKRIMYNKLNLWRKK